MSQQPYASDWVNVGDNIEYSREKELWYDTKSCRVYDEVSARHNGIIGVGAQLRQMLKEHYYDPSN